MDNLIIEWPYPVNYGKVNEVETDVLIIGGGIAGSWAAIKASERGVKVSIVEEMDVFSAGPAGCDHWHFAYTNPACKVSPDEVIEAAERAPPLLTPPLGFAEYIAMMESYDALLELEKMGAKVRDTEDEFKGAPFRDEETKLLFAYDYDERSVIRVWGQTFRQALYQEIMRRRIQLFNRVLVTSLLTEDGKIGSRVVGAMGVHTRTGEFFVFRAKATVLCTGAVDHSNRFLGYFGYTFNSHHAPSMSGAGLVMAFNAGAEVMPPTRLVWYLQGTTPSYSTGNPFNTWYPCTIVDAKGKEIPWIDDATGRKLSSFEDRVHYARFRGFKFLPPPGYPMAAPISHSSQGFKEFIEGVQKGEYILPLYADLSSMPEHERRAIFGLMIPQEGKCWILYRNLTQGGFDPNKDMLQCYWTGMNIRDWLHENPLLHFLDPFSLAGGYSFFMDGGIWHDWDFKTSLEGLYVAGDISLLKGHAGAAVSGRWVGAKAAEYAKKSSLGNVDWNQVDTERKRVYAPAMREGRVGVDWKSINTAICTVMRTYVYPALVHPILHNESRQELLKIALTWLKELEEGEVKKLIARNPHELTRTLETLNILANSKLIILYNLKRIQEANVSKEKMRGEVSQPHMTMLLKEEGKIEFKKYPPKWWLLPPYAPTYRENYERHKPW
ncbi:MAG: FAD-dependent oxidoreductase [Candidatus Bathyarchaeia archaeon]